MSQNMAKWNVYLKNSLHNPINLSPQKEQYWAGPKTVDCISVPTQSPTYRVFPAKLSPQWWRWSFPLVSYIIVPSLHHLQFPSLSRFCFTSSEPPSTCNFIIKTSPLALHKFVFRLQVVSGVWILQTTPVIICSCSSHRNYIQKMVSVFPGILCDNMEIREQRISVVCSSDREF